MNFIPRNNELIDRVSLIYKKALKPRGKIQNL